MLAKEPREVLEIEAFDLLDELFGLGFAELSQKASKCS